VNAARFCLWLVIVPALLLLGTGCGGFGASQSISPLNFLLPGLIHKKPAEEAAPVAVVPQGEPVKIVAQSL